MAFAVFYEPSMEDDVCGWSILYFLLEVKKGNEGGLK